MCDCGNDSCLSNSDCDVLWLRYRLGYCGDYRLCYGRCLVSERSHGCGCRPGGGHSLNCSYVLLLCNCVGLCHGYSVMILARAAAADSGSAA